ncbi:MAG: pyrroline-5-carboxylate reductase [Acidimicrobiales bacterium]
MTRLVVVGAGRMGQALVGGLLRSGWIEPSELAVAEKSGETRAEVERRYLGVSVSERPVRADSAVLAVKPADAEEAARSVSEVGVRRVVSIVAGLPIAELEKWLGEGVAALRAMPNMPAVVGAGASGLSGGASAKEEDFAWAEAVLSSVGVVARVPERLLDAVTGLSGSGPAYVLVLVEAMIEAGVGLGLDREVSSLLSVQTLLGSARLLVETGQPPEDIRSRVTSPGGTTAAGIRELERQGFRSSVIEAVEAAAARSREIGNSVS